MSTTKADKLLRSLIDAGLSLTEFTILATKILRLQRDLKSGNEDRRQRDRLRQQEKLREQHHFEQQLKDEEQRRLQGLNKLREFGYVTNDGAYQIVANHPGENFDRIGDKENQIRTDHLLFPYSKEMNSLRQRQRDCCLTFNIDYDLRRNQQTLESACRRAKRNIYELRAERFNRPESRSILSVETATLHTKLKEAIREINKMFVQSTADEDKRYLQELLTYINQYEGDVDLLMCQMQYEPKVKETIVFSPVTTDILDRMNLILHQVRTVANQISTSDYLTDNLDEELPNDQSSLPNKVVYIIKVKTNDQISSSLSNESNVSMKLHGTYIKSPDINLIQSVNKTKWQSGQIDLFNIELNYLGDLYAIEIWLDSEYSSWKVDWIEIIDDAANIYRFPLDRLFDKYSDEKKTRFIIQRDLGPVNRLPTKPVKQMKPYNQIGFSTYTVKVKTGKQPNKVTDSAIFFQLKGENGSFSDQLYSANSAFKSSVFEPDQFDTFYLVWPHLSKIESLHLLVQSEGIHPAWFCEYITVEDGQTGEKYKFLVNQLFDGSNPDDPNLKRHLMVYPENSNRQDVNKVEKDKPGYLMKIKTGEKGLSNISTIPSIKMILKGEKGKSEPYTLKPSDNQRKLFGDNQTDEFVIPSKYYIGPIRNLQLASNDPVEKWFIENIIMRDVAQGKDYIFPIYKWFHTLDGKPNLNVQPINEQKADYKVYTRTIASDLKGPDRSIKLLLHGSKGKQEVELSSPISMANTFQPGRKDEFNLENIQSLGNLQLIEVDITHPNIKKLGLDYIEIKDLTTNESYRFTINRMLDSKKAKMVSKAELIPRSTTNPPSSKTNPNQLNVSNTTNTMPSRPNFDQLISSVPQGAKRVDKKSRVSIKVDDEFAEDDFNQFDSENVWREKSISLLENSSKSDQALREDNYQIKIKTMNKEFLDKDTKLQVELIDDKGQAISNQRGNNLQKGKIDTFNIETPKHFGKLKNVKLSLIEFKSKKKNLYQPESIEIYHPNTNKTHRLEYTNDDLLNSEKNQLELTKPIQPPSDTNIREQTRPQGAGVPSTKTNRSPYRKLTERILSENDEETISLPNQTLTSSISEDLSKETNSYSEKNPNRQIRPGDRVKNSSKRPLISPQSKASLHEADWFRGSIETNKDHRKETKQMQLTGDKRASQTKFDQQQADLIQSKRSLVSDSGNQKIHRQGSQEKNVNLLPKKSSSKQANSTKAMSKFANNKQQYSNESSTEMTNIKTRMDSNQMKRRSEKISSAQQLSINQKRDSDSHMQENYPTAIKEQKHRSKPTTGLPSSSKPTSAIDQKQTTVTNDPTDTIVPLHSQTSLNRTEPNKSSNITVDPSTRSSNTSRLSSEKKNDYDRMPIKPNSTAQSIVENSGIASMSKQRTQSPTPSKHDQKSTISNIYNSVSHQSTSTPPQSRTSSDTPQRRSQSASSSRIPSNASSTIPKAQSQSLSNVSPSSTKSNQISLTKNPPTNDSRLFQLASKTTAHSARTGTPSNQMSRSSTEDYLPNNSPSESIKANNSQRPQVTIADSIFDEFNSQADVQNISGVTIPAIETKSDSDLHPTRRSIDYHESEHSLEKNALLSPDNAKKSRKSSQQNFSKTSGNIHHKSDVSSDTSSIKKTDNLNSSTTEKYLSKETSDVQYSPRPRSGQSRSNPTSLPIEFKSSDALHERVEEDRDSISRDNHPYTDESLTQKVLNSRETNSKQSSMESSHLTSSNISTKTGQSAISAVTTENQRLPQEISDYNSLQNPSINPNLSNKLVEVDQMSTVYEESEPSTISIPHAITSSLRKHDANQDKFERSSTPSPNPRNQKSKTSSKEKSRSSLLSKSSRGSNHHKKTIDAKTILTSTKSNTTIDYEFRVQTGNESYLAGTNEHLSIELINTEGYSMKIPLVNSINNSKPFHKGQLDIFHLTIPNQFQNIKKINLSLSHTAKDLLHIRYCELQDRQTMNTLYFPVEKCLGENHASNVEMLINASLS